MWCQEGLEAAGSAAVRGNKGETWATNFFVVSAGKAKQGKVRGLGLPSVHNFSGLCGIALVPNCPVPGPEVI